MPNGMPTWEEWNEQLTQEQRNYGLYKILKSMDARLAECPGRWLKCDARFSSLDRRKRFDTGFSGIMGIVGGALAVVGKKLLGL